jgi:hypothetical protein
MVARCGSRPFYDIAVRDVVLSIASCTLANLTEARDTARNSQTQKGGFFHDGRFPTLRAVVDHYDGFLKTGLTEDEKNDLVAYLRTL